MAAAMEVSSSLVPTAHTKRLEGTLVAPRKKQAVPNHLADTKLFGRPSSCTGPLQIHPSTVYFQGFNVGSIYRQMIRIVNSSRINQSMHIIPPDTDYFNIKYSKKTSSLVPGLSLNIMIEFRPTHWRHYTDCIRIHCKGEHNVLIPVHGFLVANTSSFPCNLNFPPIPVGQTHTKWLSLRSDVPMEFEFSLSYNKAHSAFTVDPMKGTIPKNGDTKLKVSFAPTEFQTATMELQLDVCQFDFAPLLCSVTGTSSPGLTLEQLKQQLLLNEHVQHQPSVIPTPQSPHTSQPLSPSVLSFHLSNPSQNSKLPLSSSLQPAKPSQPLEKPSQHALHSQSSSSTSKESQLKLPFKSQIESPHTPPNIQASQQPPQSSESVVSAQSSVTDSKKMPISKARVKISGKLSPTKNQVDENEIYMDGFHVPANLNTHSAVGKVLLQEPGKLKASQLKRNLETTGDDDAIITGVSRQIKEAGFLQAIKQIESEEKANLFRWVTHMGGSPPTQEEQLATVKQMKVLDIIYQNSIHIATKDVSERREHVSGYTSRTIRAANEWPEKSEVFFDCYENNLWTSRLHVHQRFVQAVRKVIVRSRTQSNLEILKKLRELVTKGESVKEAVSLMYPKKSSIISVAPLLHFKAQEFCTFSFPNFSGQSKSKDGLKQSLDQDPVDDKGVSLPDLKEDICYLDLEVPEQSYLLGYTELLTPKEGSYIPIGFYKQFLSGAEGEMESLGHIPGVKPSFLAPDAFKPILASPFVLDEKSAQRSEVPSSTPSPAVNLSETSSSFSLPPSIDHSSTTQPDSDVLNLLRRKIAPEMGSALNDTQELYKQKTLDAPETERKPIIIPNSLLMLPMPSALQILDPSPEAVDYFSLLPNTEAQLDHTLLPLPLYNSSRYPVVRLDPLDVIPGLMMWKKFSSPCLSALEKEKKLSSCWKPCRTDPFFTAGLLPQEPVESVDVMSGCLKEDMVKAEKSNSPMTMDSIKSMFPVPSTNGSKEESGAAKKQVSILIHDGLNELEEHHFKTFNQLGEAIKSRLDSFLDLSTDGDT